MKWMNLILAAAMSLLVGCSDDTTCSSDSDCFAGEFCDDGACRGGTAPENNSNNVNSTNNSNNVNNTNNSGSNNLNNTNNVNNTNNTNNTNNVNSTNNVNNTNNQQSDMCIVDLFGNVCEDDSFEDNDRKDLEEMATDQQAWCDNGVLVTPVQTFSGSLCPGDPGDYFRMQIDNRSPHECLADTFTVRMTVELDQTCAPENLQVQPYTFFDNPDVSSLCATDGDVRCEIQEEGQKYVIDWVWTTEQLPDPRLVIAPTRDDVELDYTVTVEIFQ